MDLGLVGQLGLMGLLLAGSGFFSGSETALFGLSRVKRRAMERRPESAARTALALLSEPRRLLITILIGNTFVNVALSSLGTSVAERSIGGSQGLGLAIFAVTALLLVVGEVMPKVLAVRFGERFSLRVAPWLSLVHTLLAPVARWFEAFTNTVLRFLPAGETTLLSTRELSTLLKIGEEGGAIHAGEVELVEAIIALRETDARDVMTPRVEVEGLPFDPPPEDLVRTVKRLGRRVLPLFGEDLEWCWRLRSSGFPVRYLPRAEVVHHGNQSAGQRPPAWRILRTHETKYLFCRRAYGPLRERLHRGVDLIGYAIRSVLFTVLGTVSSRRRAQGVEYRRILRILLFGGKEEGAGS